MSFSTRLKERREAIGMSRAELARKLDVTVSAIGNYENGISSPKEEILYKIFKVLSVEPNYLWQDEMHTSENVFNASFPEQKIVEKYRGLDAHGKEMVNFVLDKEHDRCVNPPQAHTLKVAARGQGVFEHPIDRPFTDEDEKELDEIAARSMEENKDL